MFFGGDYSPCVCVTHEDWLSFRKCLHKFTLLKRIIGTIPSGQHITSCHCIHPHCLLSHSSGPRWKDLMATPHVCNQRLYNAFCLGLTIQFDSFLTAIFALVPLAELARAFWSDGGERGWNCLDTAAFDVVLPTRLSMSVLESMYVFMLVFWWSSVYRSSVAWSDRCRSHSAVYRLLKLIWKEWGCSADNGDVSTCGEKH